MHCSSTIGAVGPLLQVFVIQSTARRQAEGLLGDAAPPQVSANLLVDTGASMTTLTDPIIEKLGLHPTGSIGVLTPTTGAVPHQVSLYDVDLIIPGMHGHTQTITNLPISGCKLEGQAIDGLIGRDVLAFARLTYSGPDNHYFLSI